MNLEINVLYYYYFFGHKASIHGSNWLVLVISQVDDIS